MHTFYLSLFKIDWIQQMVLLVDVIPHLIVSYAKTLLKTLLEKRKKRQFWIWKLELVKLWSEMLSMEDDHLKQQNPACVWDLHFNRVKKKNSRCILGEVFLHFNLQCTHTKKLYKKKWVMAKSLWQPAKLLWKLLFPLWKDVKTHPDCVLFVPHLATTLEDTKY